MPAKKPAPKKKPKHRTPRPTLSAREVRFCRAFTETGNATQSYIDAGLKHSSRVSAASAAYLLLRKLQIRQCVRRMQQEAADAEQITVNKLAQSLAHEAFAVRGDIFDAQGRMKPPAKWPLALQAILVGCKVREVRDPRTGAVREVIYEPKFAGTTEAKRILAQWRGMIGAKEDTAAVGESFNVVIRGPDAPPAAEGEADG